MTKIGEDISIAIDRTLNGGAALQEAMKKIFAPDFDPQLVRSLPDFWRPFFASIVAPDPDKPGAETILKVGQDGVTAPRLISSVDPEMSDAARKSKVGGVSTISIVLDSSGHVRNLSVAKPIGMGLDEQAVEAVRHFLFKPAMQLGKPVSVAISIDEEFRIY